MQSQNVMSLFAWPPNAFQFRRCACLHLKIAQTTLILQQEPYFPSCLLPPESGIRLGLNLERKPKACKEKRGNVRVLGTNAAFFKYVGLERHFMAGKTVFFWCLSMVLRDCLACTLIQHWKTAFQEANLRFVAKNWKTRNHLNLR